MTNWADHALLEGVAAEPVTDDGRLLVWASVAADGSLWDRIGARIGVPVDEGRFRWTPAVAFRVARKGRPGLFRSTLSKLRRRDEDSSWSLPDGTPVERRGARRANLVLAWSEGGPLDEGILRTRWPEAGEVRRLGGRLFLVEVEKLDEGASTTKRPDAPPAEVSDAAQRLLEAARRRGDRRGEAGVLSDLGVHLMNAGDGGTAVERLHDALSISRELGDRPLEADVLSNLGYALLTVGRPRDALGALGSALALSEEIGDPYARKLALERLAMARANLRDPAGAISVLDEAMRSTQALGDAHQESRLLWMRAIAFAELGRRDLAAQAAEQSTTLLRSLGRPEAAWYEEQLRRYRDEGSIFSVGLPAGRPALDPSGPGGASGPGLLRMAISATKAMNAFVASGMKTTPPDARSARLAACRTCTHHTGLRCRVCGCFTEAKSRMAHERCPLGKWHG